MNWISYIGAAAWVPHLYNMLYKRFAKPNLRFFPYETIQIGYMIYGPILIETFVVRTLKKDALIEEIKAKVVHESGDKHEFRWKFLSEMGYEMTTISGNIAEFRKNKPAIALPVTITGLTEQKILFQDVDYEKKLMPLYKQFQEKETYLKKSQKENYKQTVIKTQEFFKISDFIKREFYWKEGKYDVFLYARESSLKTSHTEHFGFELTSANIEGLERNIEEIQNYLKDSIIYKGVKPEEMPQHILNWVFPSLHRK